ncbi:hypothetical protein KGM_200826 [Danaus plexippus plexippus]|uniref:Uncharacterized protein n=1 Tax=Danaus plexippus plexippus TaxID=278856 RepID=A0A212EZ32_DANPL|nr:hypothetical protein KGM_200826 [Danaus plexippus plexippus]
MGLITSRDQTMLDGPVGTTKNHHVRQPSTRNRTKPPMPDRDELESRFIKVLLSSIRESIVDSSSILYPGSIMYSECMLRCLLMPDPQLMRADKPLAVRYSERMIIMNCSSCI